MKITLNNIRFHAFHGCLPQERTVGGDFLVSVTLHLPDDVRALQDDSLEGTVDYGAAYAAVREEMRKPSNLLEHVAHRIAQRLLRDFAQAERVGVSITKIAPPIRGAFLDGATVELSEGRQ